MQNSASALGQTFFADHPRAHHRCCSSLAQSSVALVWETSFGRILARPQTCDHSKQLLLALIPEFYQVGGEFAQQQLKIPVSFAESRDDSTSNGTWRMLV